MVRWDFDLESAKFELECVENLLCIYQEFFSEEIPEKDLNYKDAQMGALMFVENVRCYHSIIDAAHDKIMAMRKVMEAAIEKGYSESRKEVVVN